MNDLEAVTQRLDAIKRCAPADIHAHFEPALRRFRFIPHAERRICAEAFLQWADGALLDAQRMRAYATFLVALDRFISEDFRPALSLLIRARTLMAECHDDPGLGLCAMLIGGTYRTFGNYELALKVCWEAFGLLVASGQYPIFVAATANTMASIAYDMGDLDEAAAKWKITYDESAGADDFYFATYGLQGMGRVFMQRDQHVEAEDMFRRALAMAEQNHHPGHISSSLTELATFQFRMGHLDEAQSLSERALEIREERGLSAGAVTNCLRLAEIRGRRGQWEEALPLLTKALDIAESVDIKPKMAQVHFQLSELFERLHDPERSLSHYKLYHELHEQVQREDSARKLADARLIFEAEQTRKENVIIREQKAEIERKNVELQDTIDELTRAKIGRKAKAMTLALVIVLFVLQDLLLRTALGLLASNNYFLLLGVKMGIIFSLAPINRGIERHLLRQVTKRNKARALPLPA